MIFRKNIYSCIIFFIGKMFFCFFVFEGLFKVFDENEDGHIDFREMACGIAACCRGTSVNQQHCKFEMSVF